MGAVNEKVLDELATIKVYLQNLQRDLTDIKQKLHELGPDVPFGKVPAGSDT